jgi:hypothetical protein
MVVQLPPLSEDVCTVRWYAVLEDADATEGLFHFTVREPAVAPGDVTLPAPLSPNSDGGVPILGIAALLVAILTAMLVWLRARAAQRRGQPTPTGVREENA